MLARTMVKNALPISFGFKVAGWLESLIRLDKRFKNAEKTYFTLFFGGAVGAMHGYKNKGKKFTNQLAKNLGFSNSLVPNRVSLETGLDFINDHKEDLDTPIILLTAKGLSLIHISSPRDRQKSRMPSSA